MGCGKESLSIKPVMVSRNLALFTEITELAVAQLPFDLLSLGIFNFDLSWIYYDIFDEFSWMFYFSVHIFSSGTSS